MVFFLDDYCMLVELVCGVVFVCVYEFFFKVWQEQGKLGELKFIFVIVCGGNLVLMKVMKEWKDKFGFNQSGGKCYVIVGLESVKKWCFF